MSKYLNTVNVHKHLIGRKKKIKKHIDVWDTCCRPCEIANINTELTFALEFGQKSCTSNIAVCKSEDRTKLLVVHTIAYNNNKKIISLDQVTKCYGFQGQTDP